MKPQLFAAALLAVLPLTAGAAQPDRLIELINGYRADPPVCAGEKAQPLPPLAPEPQLAEIRMSQQQALPQALQAAGYRAARAEAVRLSGPADAQQAFQFAVAHHCKLLLNPRYAVIGVSQQGSTWQMIFAQPLLSGSLGSWQAAGQQVLQRVNEARRQSRQCGEKAFEAAAPLRWNEALANAALTHSDDMAQHDYFAHEGRDGSTVATRAQAQGYRWRDIGENIAAGQGSAEQVVQSWLASPSHCANIMNDSFTEMGAAYVYDAGSDAGIYWTQVLGRPR